MLNSLLNLLKDNFWKNRHNSTTCCPDQLALFKSSQTSKMELFAKHFSVLDQLSPTSDKWLGFWAYFWLETCSQNWHQILKIKKDIEFLVET